jgi:hypothetical protein
MLLDRNGEEGGEGGGGGGRKEERGDGGIDRIDAVYRLVLTSFSV